MHILLLDTQHLMNVLDGKPQDHLAPSDHEPLQPRIHRGLYYNSLVAKFMLIKEGLGLYNSI